MNVIQFVSAAGLLGLVGGILLVNIVATPRAAQTGTIMAGCGVVMLVIVAARQLPA